MTWYKVWLWIKYLGWLPWGILTAVIIIARYAASREAWGRAKGVADTKKEEIKREDDSDLHSRITDFK